MTPLALVLEGFTCYRTRARIDWSEAGAGLFAVTGPTGAGKSTILDAITYVLYGKTARLGSRGLDALLSPGADSLFVQLEFRNARGVYRVTRAAQRRSTGAVATEVRIEVADAEANADGWRQLSDSERVRDANDALQGLVGLDYDGFTRAVLLPQGAFDEFLRGDAAQRRKLLVSLLGLDRVGDIQRLAGQRASVAEERVAALQARLAEDYADVDPGSVSDLKEQEAALEAQLAELAATVEGAGGELKEVEETARLAGEHEALKAERKRLSEGAPAIAQLKVELERGRRAAVLASHFPRLEAAEARREAAAKTLATRREALDKAQEGLGAARKALDAAQERAEQRRGAIDTELAALAEVGPAFEALKRRGGDLALAAAVPDGPGASFLDEDEWAGWHTALSVLVPAFERAAREVEKRTTALERARQDAGKAAARAEQLEAAQAQRVEAGKALAAEEEGAKAALEVAQRADLAAAVRAGLSPGDPCPVCGGPVGEHAPATDGGHLAEAEEALRTATAAVAKARDEYQERRAELVRAQAEHANLVRQVADAEGALTTAHEALANARADLERHGARTETDEGGTGADAGYEAAIGRLRRGLEERRDAALASHARAIVHKLAAAGVDATGRDDLGRRGAQLKEEREGLEERLRSAERAFQEAERAAAVAGTQLEGAEENLAAAAEEARAAREALVQAVAAAGFADLEEANTAMRDAGQLASLEARIDKFERDLRGAEQREVELAAKLAARPPLPAVPAEPDGQPASGAHGTAQVKAAAIAKLLQDRLADLRVQLDELRRKQGELSAERRSLETRLERSTELRKQLAAAQDSYELHRQLALDLRGNNFPDHLMAQVQQRLARRASQVLRNVTDGRFDLHLADGDYLVADAWAGGDMRSARTLSGGESFVASLALALALSDTLAGNASLGALFLDEGFGTLDRATLEAVANVLESLTDEGRMVGVITHVPELSERLPARLVVSKGPEGSTVAWDA